jgi:predicted nuclease with TOPRIM domain
MIELPKKELEDLIERLKNCENNNKKLKEAVKFLNEEIEKINSLD